MLITLLIVVLLVVLALYGASLLSVDGRLTMFLQLLIIVVAIVYLAGMLR